MFIWVQINANACFVAHHLAMHVLGEFARELEVSGAIVYI